MSANSDSRTWTVPHTIAWLCGLALWALAVLSVASYSPADPPGHAMAPHHGADAIANLGGLVGARFAHEALLALGVGVWVVLAGWALALGLWAFGKRASDMPLRMCGVVMVAIAVSALHAFLLPGWSSRPEGGGGVIAIAAVDALELRFGDLTFVILTLGMLIGLLVAFDRWVFAAPAAAARWFVSLVYGKLTPALAGIGSARHGAWARPNDVDDDAELRAAARRRSRRAERAEAEGFDADEEDAAVAVAERPAVRRKKARPAPIEVEDDVDEAGEEDEGVPGAPQVFSESELRDKIAKLPVRFAGSGKTSATAEDLDELRRERQSEAEVERNYVFPGLDLLEDPDTNYDEKLEAYVREQAEALERALTEYGIKGEVAAIESGPVITLYQVRLAPGTKVAAIQAVSSDIARALKAVNIRIVPNTEGRDTVGVEVPNQVKERVRIKELMSRHERASKMKLPLFLGKDASGDPLIVDLASLPHVLIAGTTGSGKSVCMNAIIMGFLYTQKPTDLKLAMVDPKMVELSQFRDIPHLMTPVITEMSKAAAILEWAVGKMDERYELLAAAGCRDIGGYNGLSWEEKKERLEPRSEVEEARIPRKLPYMVFIIDELADLMMTHKEVESSIVRIAQKARAVGIHLILATQRPQANVVTGLIKSNMPGRISFKVASGMDSRIVLDQKGGELLLGQGDMLMITPRSSRAMRAQGTLVDDAETRRVVRFIKQHSAASYERQLVQLGDEREVAAADADERFRAAAQEDPLFDKAVEMIIESGRGSVSLLQRRLAIGYTRSSRLIEMMGEAGILGKHKGTVARDVVMTLEEWHAIKEMAESPGEEDDGQGDLFAEAPGGDDAQAAAGGAGELAPFLSDDDAEPVVTVEESPEPEPIAVDEGEDEKEDEDSEDEEEDGDEEAGEDDDDEYEYEYEYVDDDEDDEEGDEEEEEGDEEGDEDDEEWEDGEEEDDEEEDDGEEEDDEEGDEDEEDEDEDEDEDDGEWDDDEEGDDEDEEDDEDDDER